jgi:hypothetical protein
VAEPSALLCGGGTVDAPHTRSIMLEAAITPSEAANNRSYHSAKPISLLISRMSTWKRWMTR